MIVCDGSSLEVKKKTGVEYYAQQILGLFLKMPTIRLEIWAKTPIEQIQTRALAWPLKRGWLAVRWVLETHLRRPAVVWIPGRGVPFGTRGRVAVTLHDVAVLSHPELYSDTERHRQQRAIQQIEQRADLVICVSEATQREWKRLVPAARAKTVVTPLGVNTERFFPYTSADASAVAVRFPHLPTPFHLMIGRVEEKKGLSFVLDLLENGGFEQPLIWAGSFGYGVEPQMSRIQQLEQDGRLILCSYVPEDDLPLLLRCATSLWFPSRAEGFGLPILEAFASRVPVLTSNLSVLEEVGGDARVCVSDELHVWIDHLRVLEEQGPDSGLLDKGEERAKAATWQRTAERTMAALIDLERGVY